MIHTSHKLEGLGNEFILAFRHFGGILGAARTWTLIAALLGRRVCGGWTMLVKSGGGSELVFAAEVTESKTIRWFLVGRAVGAGGSEMGVPRM